MNQETFKKIKETLLKQIENFPEENRALIKHKVLSMSQEELEEFLKENDLEHLDPSKKEVLKEKCIFCKINSGEIASIKIDENKEAMAILEINPSSEGHLLILPKKHSQIEKIDQEMLNYIKKLTSLLKEKLSPEEIRMSTKNLFGHTAIELIPFYANKPNERKKLTEEELEKIKKKILEEKKQEKIVEEKKEIVKIKKRIP
jgi:histidine triad (HIT) family protein